MASVHKSLLEDHGVSFDVNAVDPEEIGRFRQMTTKFLTGNLAADHYRRYRLQHGIYSMRDQTGGFMVRIRVPLGCLTARQLKTLGQVAGTYASGYGHVTTRQDVQLYGVSLERLPGLLEELAQAGLTTRETSGNGVRNIITDPLAGVASDEAFDVRPYAAAVTRHFLRNPISQNLGRKFKISFSGSSADRAFAHIQDVGAIARLEHVDDRWVRGFELFIGGGLGATPRLGGRLEPFTPADHLLPTLEAIVRIFDRLGERQNKNKARLKFLIARIGMDAFRKLVFQERAILPLVNPRAYPTIAVDDGDPVSFDELRADAPYLIPHVEGSDQQRWLHTNVFPQKQRGFMAVYIRLPVGDLTADQFQRLGEIVAQYAAGEIFTTPTQNLVFRWVPEGALLDIYHALQEIGLGGAGAHRAVDVTSCPGAETCPLAITRSRQLAQELIRRLDGQPDRYLSDELKDLNIKISGCPNSCGHHHIAAIGLYGTARRVRGRQAPHYRLLLGGGVLTGGARLGRVVGTIPARYVPQANANLAIKRPSGIGGNLAISPSRSATMSALHSPGTIAENKDVDRYP